MLWDYIAKRKKKIKNFFFQILAMSLDVRNCYLIAITPVIKPGRVTLAVFRTSNPIVKSWPELDTSGTSLTIVR